MPSLPHSSHLYHPKSTRNGFTTRSLPLIVFILWLNDFIFQQLFGCADTRFQTAFHRGVGKSHMTPSSPQSVQPRWKYWPCFATRATRSEFWEVEKKMKNEKIIPTSITSAVLGKAQQKNL